MAETNLGPKAPKDPTKKRNHFYIMRNKPVSASPSEDGKGVCFIYEDDGRMVSAARLVGGIEDEEELKLLETTEGFRKLVHSVGVSVETSENIDSVRFVLQMYGKEDIYGGGTNIIADVPTNGVEVVIDLNQIEWRSDDNVPGQIRFEFEKSGPVADVSVCFYLQDGFDAPEVEEESSVDFDSKEYDLMIDNAIMQQGNNYRIKKALEKARRGEETTLAFIGGSVTQGAGAVPINTQCYARKIYEGFCQLAGVDYDKNVKYIKAGVGGTPSELGMLRYKRDIVDESAPDLVVIEFAVNDAGDETGGECYDSLVRKAYNGPGNPAVVLLFGVFADDFNLQDRLSPVGLAYNLPMVSTKNSVTEQFYKKATEGRIVTKNQFFYDRYHPSNIGHKIMADGVIRMLQNADKAEPDEEVDIKSIAAPIGGDYENVYRIDRKENEVGAVIDCGSFAAIDKETQYVERNMDAFGTLQFVDNWMHPENGKDDVKPFTMDVKCKSILLIYKDSGENKVGKADVYVDGKKTYYVDPRVIGWTHCNAVIIHRGEESSEHHVEVHMASGSEDKEFTILGFGVVL